MKSMVRGKKMDMATYRYSYASGVKISEEFGKNLE